MLSQKLKEKQNWLFLILSCQSSSKDRGPGSQWPAENRPIMLPAYWCTLFQTKLNSSLRIITHINAWLDKDHIFGNQWPFQSPPLVVFWTQKQASSQWACLIRRGVSGHGSLETGQTSDRFDRLACVKNTHSTWRTPLKAFISIRVTSFMRLEWLCDLLMCSGSATLIQRCWQTQKTWEMDSSVVRMKQWQTERWDPNWFLKTFVTACICDIILSDTTQSSWS